LTSFTTTRFAQFARSFACLILLPALNGCRQASWTLWDSYSVRFIDRQGRVIDPQSNRTTSEGEAYALFFSLVANDRRHFDSILKWTQDNLAQGDLDSHLPAWSWGKDTGGVWKVLDQNSASDADTWLAYTLVEAGRLWNQPGYTQLGLQLVKQIAGHEVVDLPGFGPMLAPGPVGFERQGSWTLNPSYLPEFIFERLAAVDPSGPWRQIAAGIPRLLRQASPNGFAMDWVNYAPGVGFSPAPQSPGKPDAEPGGSYDAIRVYLWAGMLSENDPMRSEILAAIPAMSAYLAQHDAPPERISGRGIPSAQDGGAGFSAAVVPYLRAMRGNGKALARQTIRLSAERDPTTGLYGKSLTYYDQNLALFATGFLDKRYRFAPDGELQVAWVHS
jgi:endo-1,4-beta-D-glucanase Y